MPTPKKNETRQQWMKRCVPDLISENRKQDQAVAICLDMWRDKKETKMEDERKDKVWKFLKGIFAHEPENANKNVHPFMVWKEADDEYRWLAVYSNKWRDEDSPPEILASAAHKEFVEAVDKGDWPYPELWLWHIPGSRFGVADTMPAD